MLDGLEWSEQQYLVIKYCLYTLLGIGVGFACKIFLFMESMSLKHLQIYVLIAIQRIMTGDSIQNEVPGPESGLLMVYESMSLKNTGVAPVEAACIPSCPPLFGGAQVLISSIQVLGDSQFLSSQPSKKGVSGEEAPPTFRLCSQAK